MKPLKLVLLLSILSLSLSLGSCDKNNDSGGDGDPMQGWNFQFILVDSVNQNLFDPYQGSYETGTNRDTTPFDPLYIYFIDGLGQKLQPHFFSSPSAGMVFGLSKSAGSLFEERDITNSSIYTWLVYLEPSNAPDTLVFKDPAIHGSHNVAEFILYNSDTIYKYGQEPFYFKIQYP